MFVVCSVFDRKAEEFGTLFIARTPGAACRLFIDAVSGGDDTQVSQHPEDFYLAQVGAFNEETGELVPMGDRHHLMLMEAVEAGGRKMSPEQYAADKARGGSGA